MATILNWKGIIFLVLVGGIGSFFFLRKSHEALSDVHFDIERIELKNGEAFELHPVTQAQLLEQLEFSSPRVQDYSATQQAPSVSSVQDFQEFLDQAFSTNLNDGTDPSFLENAKAQGFEATLHVDDIEGLIEETTGLAANLRGGALLELAMHFANQGFRKCDLSNDTRFANLIAYTTVMVVRGLRGDQLVQAIIWALCDQNLQCYFDENIIFEWMTILNHAFRKFLGKTTHLPGAINCAELAGKAS